MKKKLFLISIITFVFFITGILDCNASTNTYNREDLTNYGVNKKWKITDTNKDNILKTPAVNAEEKIYDFSDILTEEEEITLKNRIDTFIEQTNMDLAIVTVNLPYSYDEKNEEYATDFYDYNDFGLKLDNYSGVVLLRNTYEADPYYDFYMFGNAQLYFQSDGREDNILDAIYSELHGKNYLLGFSEFVDLLSNYYNQGIPKSMENYEVDDMGYLQKKYNPPFLLATVISLVVTSVIMFILVKKNKMITKLHHANNYLDQQSINYTEKRDDYVTSHTTSYTESSSSGGGGFSSSGGSSGGGHSSGGGRHG